MPSTADQLADRIRAYHPAADVELVKSAWEFSRWAHRDQTRKSGDPYFTHPVAVAGIISELRLDTASVCAGLLHDVVEDTGVPLSEIDQRFGPEVATLVDGVTKLGKVNFSSKEDRQAESFRKLVVAMAQDIRVLLVKLCDRLDNMRTLEHMSPDAQERIAGETMEIYAPLANRLGMQRLRAELEDLSLRYLEPESFREIAAKLHSSQRERDRYIEGVCKTLQSRLAEHHFAADVSGRAKHVCSVWRKMKEQQCAFEDVYDVLAFRIIVETIADCYAVLGAVHSRWTPVSARFKDYIALPKPNQYQSLHTTVIGPGGRRIEVQIRTHEMHSVAEVGVAAHWRYKERHSGGLDPRDAERFGWLRELAEVHKSVRDPAEFVQSVKVELFHDEVSTFTPKGKVITLPRGATPIDFAFAIHSDVGFRCTGAKVNGQIVPLRYKLRDGDVVEVLTGNAERPSRDWLDFIITGRARARLRGYFRAELRQKSINLGRELLETALHGAGVSFAKLWKNEDQVRRLVEHHRTGTRDELLLAIGYGKLDPDEVAAQLKTREAEQSQPVSLKPSPLETIVRKVTGKDTGGIRVTGIDDVLVRYARCCNPLPGDPIIGFITRGRGATIHRRECLKALDNDPERRIEVSWDSKAKVNRPVSIKVITANKPGILATVSQTFSAQKINISEANCRAEEGDRACNVFTFSVSDLAQLRGVMKALTKVAGVVEVARV